MSSSLSMEPQSLGPGLQTLAVGLPVCTEEGGTTTGLQLWTWTVCPNLSSATYQLGHLEHITHPLQICTKASVCLHGTNHTGIDTQAFIFKFLPCLPTLSFL